MPDHRAKLLWLCVCGCWHDGQPRTIGTGSSRHEPTQPPVEDTTGHPAGLVISARFLGWCPGGHKDADPDGACRRCGYRGKVSDSGLVPHHKDRRSRQ